MDNITHTLIGVMVGDTAERCVPASGPGLPARTRRAIGLGLMIVGSNLPDADFIYSAVTGSKLDYLLQHRGHTHTVLGAIVLALVMVGAVAMWLRFRRIAWSATDARYLLGLAILAPLLHLCLDASNSYGVHPFWPLQNDWFYGDAVFIVEPLLWVTATPLLFTLSTMLGRSLVALAVLAGVALSFLTGLVPPSLAVALTVLVGVLGLISRYTGTRMALASGIFAWLGITAMFITTGAAAEAKMNRLLTSDYPDARTLDVVLTPMPVNPLCREVFVVQTESQRYIIRKATLSIAPGWLSAQECPQRTLGAASTAPLTAAAADSTADIEWLGEMVMPETLVGELANRFCAVRAILRFSRVPWAMARGDGWVFGDMRYDREPELGLAEIEVGPDEDECPAFIPPWTPPRADLLGTGA